MTIRIHPETLFIFDLDDTLYSELDFLYSAFGEIAGMYRVENLKEQMINWYHDGKDVFAQLLDAYPGTFTKEELITTYRQHQPDIQLAYGAGDILSSLNDHHVPMILITDGRSSTQRNKLSALGITGYFTGIYISAETGSDKKEGVIFHRLKEQYRGWKVYVLGDNVHKDFCWPLRFGWTTIGLRDQGKNIHKQENSEDSCQPEHYIDSFTELILQYE
jgi:putative hydrolase of the HAD superfamily